MPKYNQIGTKLYLCISTHVCSHVVICASSKDVCSVKARFHVCHILFPQYSTEQCFEIWQNSLMSLGTHTCPQACWLSLRLPSLEAVSPWSYSVTLKPYDAFVSAYLSSGFVPRLYSLHFFLFLSPDGVAGSILLSDMCQACSWSWLCMKIACSCGLLDLRSQACRIIFSKDISMSSCKWNSNRVTLFWRRNILVFILYF